MGENFAVNVDCHNCREPSDRVVYEITITSPQSELLEVNGEFVDAVSVRIRGALGFEDVRRGLGDALSRFESARS